ncbi:hypothetical protein BV898_06756, partial [Hypsibius exemplaris]
MAGTARYAPPKPKQHWMRRPFFKFGLPFMLTVIGGSFWLRDFAQLRYTFRTKRTVTKEEMEKMIGMPMSGKKMDPHEELKV